MKPDETTDERPGAPQKLAKTFSKVFVTTANRDSWSTGRSSDAAVTDDDHLTSTAPSVPPVLAVRPLL
jgi:hypothetical protein